jgi:hypothetical protein
MTALRMRISRALHLMEIRQRERRTNSYSKAACDSIPHPGARSSIRHRRKDRARCDLFEACSCCSPVRCPSTSRLLLGRGSVVSPAAGMSAAFLANSNAFPGTPPPSKMPPSTEHISDELIAWDDVTAHHGRRYSDRDVRELFPGERLLSLVFRWAPLPIRGFVGTRAGQFVLACASCVTQIVFLGAARGWYRLARPSDGSLDPRLAHERSVDGRFLVWS